MAPREPRFYLRWLKLTFPGRHKTGVGSFNIILFSGCEIKYQWFIRNSMLYYFQEINFWEKLNNSMYSMIPYQTWYRFIITIRVYSIAWIFSQIKSSKTAIFALSAALVPRYPQKCRSVIGWFPISILYCL